VVDRLEAAAGRTIPWHRDAAWPIVLLEGVIAVSIGLAIVAHPGSTRDLIIRLIGVYLAVSGLIGLFADWRRQRAGTDGRYTGIRHILMVVVGALAAYDPHLTSLVAWGCIIVGLAGLVLMLAVPDLGNARWGVLVISAVSIVFGFLLFWALATGTFLIAVVGLALILAGFLLVVHAIRVARGLHQGAAPAGI
jgi:uncharacterized membrane protein HdeD (DUF308 family)